MTDPQIHTSFRRFALGAFALLAPWLAACSDDGDPDPDPDPPVADSIALDPDSLTFEAIGSQERVTATVLDQYGDPMADLTIVWASDNGSVASVDQTGLVTSQGDGETRVRVQAGSERASLPVEVDQVPAELELVEGNDQRHWNGFLLREPLVVKLTDGAGTPVVGEPITWEVVEGGGDLLPTGPATDLEGLAEAGWVLGTGESGTQRAAATAGDLDPVEFQATGAAPIVLLNVDPLTAPMLDTLTARLMALDSLGQPESGTPLEFQEITGFGEIVQGPTTTDVNGELEARWALGPTPGPQEVTVARGDIQGELTIVAQATGTLDPWPFTVVAPGLSHTCAVENGGTAYCWGRSSEFQLALDDTLTFLEPTAVPTGLTWTEIDGGESHTCGLTQGGGIYCWGTGYPTGQAGDGTQVAETPTLVTAGPWTTLTSGTDHVCATMGDGTGSCWGVGEFGQLGGGAPDTTATPTAVTGAQSWARLTAGHFHTCGVTPTGEAYCWGRGAEGQIGNGEVDAKSSPALVAGGNSWIQVSAGRFHTCGISTEGDAFCWGEGGWGQLGNGSPADQTSPVKVSGGREWTDIAAGWFHSCGVDTNGKLYCWGRGDGFIGLGGFGSATPVVVLPAYTWQAVRTQGLHTCAIRSNFESYCWGPNDFGQLGIGDTDDSGVPRILVRGVL